MDPVLKLNRKCRPSLSDCGVRPLDKKVHEYLISSYILWPLIVAFGNIHGNFILLFAIFAAFLIMGFLFYNLLVALVQMSHEPKKRLRIAQWIFCTTFFVLAVRICWVLS